MDGASFPEVALYAQHFLVRCYWRKDGAARKLSPTVIHCL
jgi:hypothetical protein